MIDAHITTPALSIPLCEPHIGGNEWAYVKECLDSGWVSTAGTFVNRLEAMVCERVGAKYGIATCSGTAALHLSLLLVGVKPGEEVLVSDLTFVAPVNTIHYIQAHPVLVDCDPQTLQMDVGLVEKFLRGNCDVKEDGCFNRNSGRRVSAILPVHLLGHPIDIEPLRLLASEFGLPVVEDATESLGSLYLGTPVGMHGRLGCYSFNGNKIVTAGGGGLIVTNDEALAKRGRYLSTQAKNDPLFYVHDEVGFNYRLTNLQSALAVAQLEQLDFFIQRKREIAQIYQEAFADLASYLTLVSAQPWAFSTSWLSTILLHGPATQSRNNLLAYLESKGIQARPLWNPNHKNLPFGNCEFLNVGNHSTRIVETAISLPSSVGLTGSQQDFVCRTIREFVSQL